MLVLKALTALAMLLTPIGSSAQTSGDTVAIHVSASRWKLGIGPGSTPSPIERLNAVINGKKLQLSGDLSGPDLLIPGDYPALLISERHESADEVRQSYEILLPNNRSRTFVVTGLTE